MKHFLMACKHVNGDRQDPALLLSTVTKLIQELFLVKYICRLYNKYFPKGKQRSHVGLYMRSYKLYYKMLAKLQ